jgi:hypothetical protein
VNLAHVLLRADHVLPDRRGDDDLVCRVPRFFVPRFFVSRFMTRFAVSRFPVRLRAGDFVGIALRFAATKKKDRQAQKDGSKRSNCHMVSAMQLGWIERVSFAWTGSSGEKCLGSSE